MVNEFEKGGISKVPMLIMGSSLMDLDLTKNWIGIGLQKGLRMSGIGLADNRVKIMKNRFKRVLDRYMVEGDRR